MLDCCSPQNAEQGRALRKPADGAGASAPTRSVWTRADVWSRPTTDSTTPARLAGTLMSVLGARSVSPFTAYSPKLTPNAACACATVPSAATYRPLDGV